MVPCCVLCELDGAGIQTRALDLLLQDHVETVASMDDSEVVRTFDMSNAEGILVRNAARRVLTARGDGAKMIHDRYLQRGVLHTPSAGQGGIEIGSLIQIFDANLERDTFVQQLANQALEKMHHGVNSNLLNVPLWGYLRIDLEFGVLEHFTEMGKSTEDNFDCSGETLEEVMDELERILTPIDRVSMVSVTGVETKDAEYVPDFYEWVKFFEKVYGSLLNQMWIAVVFDVNKILPLLEQSPYSSHQKDIRRRVNSNLPKEAIWKLKWAYL